MKKWKGISPKRISLLAAVAAVLMAGKMDVSASGVRDVFDAEYYANTYPDLKAAYGNNAEALFQHYITAGLSEGRVGSAEFNIIEYRNNHPDLQAIYGDDWNAYADHYLATGKAEGSTATQQPAPASTAELAPQYADSVEYTITSLDNARAIRTEAISRQARHILLHNNASGVSAGTIARLFMESVSQPVSDYYAANICGSDSSYGGGSNVITVNFQYLSTIEEERYTDATVAQLLPQFNTGSTYNKIRAVHDYICNTVFYSHETAAGSGDFRSAYDALYHKTTVCSGYALLFQKFMDYMGIPCYVASGLMNGVPHAWNIVNIDGQWYYVDCTNADQDWGISYRGFLKGSTSFGTGPAWGDVPISPTDYPIP